MYKYKWQNAIGDIANKNIWVFKKPAGGTEWRNLCQGNGEEGYYV